MLFLYILIGIIVSVSAFYIAIVVRKSNALKKIINKLEAKGYKVVKEHNKIYDLVIEKDDIKSLVKIIYNFDKAEINVNSKNYFQINYGVVSSRKKGEKLNNCYDLIDYKTDCNKLYLIYPEAIRLMKVINECEMIFIDDSTDIYGTKMIQYNKI